MLKPLIVFVKFTFKKPESVNPEKFTRTSKSYLVRNLNLVSKEQQF